MAENENLKIEYIPVDKLKPYERNARKHADIDVDAIAASIKAFGFRDPIGVWGKNNIIVEGHGRLMAAKKLGMDSVPCVRLDDMTDEQRRGYALAHNKTAELSSWDLDTLNTEIEELSEMFDFEELGFESVLDDNSQDDEDYGEDLYSDIEKADTHYGVPYQGNKSRIADIIINLLPGGKRLVDLFGGGWSNHTLRFIKRKMGCNTI